MKLKSITVLFLALCAFSNATVWPQKQTSPLEPKQIIGGKPLVPRDWPFVVQVSTDGICTGSLIHPSWVVTNAHCFEDDIGGPVDILFPHPEPLPDGRTWDGLTWHRTSGRVILAPEYAVAVRAGRSTLDWDIWLQDIALVEVIPPIDLRDRRPIRVLPPAEESQHVPPGTPAVQIGAKVDKSTSPFKYDLRSIDVVLEDPRGPDCLDGAWSEGMATRLHELAWCAAPHIGESGDSGGPIVVKLPDGSYAQVGLHRGPIRQGPHGSFSHYVRTAAWYDWIAEYVPLHEVTNEDVPPPEVIDSTNTLNFAHFANGAGIVSDLVFLNTGTELIRPAIYFYDQLGNPIAVESVVDITGDLAVQEDGALTVQTEIAPLGELTISTHGQGEVVSGSVKVVSNGPIGGVLRFDLPGIGVAGVGASPLVRDALFPARREVGGISTAAAIHNMEEETIVVSCRLMSGGVVLEEMEISLAANGQEAQFIEEMFTTTDTSNFVGLVRCTGPGRFTGLAVELDATNRIFTTLPVAVLSSDREGLVALYDATDGANWNDNYNWKTAAPIGEWHGITEWEPTDRGDRVERLDLSDNQLNGSIPAELGNLSNLENLYLHDNWLGGSIPAELGNLSNLWYLRLNGNYLSGSIPAELGNLSNLGRLYLEDNQLSGSIPAELDNLSNLRDLDLQRNQLSGSIPAELGNLSNLRDLRLNGNQLNGCDPSRTRQPVQPGTSVSRRQPVERVDPRRTRQPVQPERSASQRQPVERVRSQPNSATCPTWDFCVSIPTPASVWPTTFY